MKTYTKEELKALVTSNNPEHRKELAAAMKHHGKPMSEVVSMKPDERIQFILDKQKASGAKPAAGGTKLGTKAAVAPKTGAKKAAAPDPEPEEEEETPAEEEEPEAEASAGGGASGEDVAALSEKVDALSEKVDALTAQNALLEKVAVETHFLLRILLQTNGVMDDDVAGFQEKLYGQLLVEVEEGNG